MNLPSQVVSVNSQLPLRAKAENGFPWRRIWDEFPGLPAHDKASLFLAAILEAMLLAVLSPVLVVALISSEWRKRQSAQDDDEFRHEGQMRR